MKDHQEAMLFALQEWRKSLDELVRHLREANKDAAGEAVFILLLQGLDQFGGPDSPVMEQFGPVLDVIKKRVHAADFEGALRQALSFQRQLDEIDLLMRKGMESMGKPAEPASISELESPVALQFKVTLKGSRPPVWRRVLIPAHLNLAGLHQVLQALFSWQQFHDHSFSIRGKTFGHRDALVDAAFDEQTGLGGLQPKESLEYTYDLTHHRIHRITLEKVVPIFSRQSLPVCLAGRGSAPPDDTRSWESSFDLSKRDSAYSSYEHFKQVKHPNWDASNFDLDTVNLALRKAFPPNSPLLASRRISQEEALEFLSTPAGKLSVLPDLQERIDEVARDLNSGLNLYAAIDPVELGEILGLDWGNRNLQGWTGSHLGHMLDLPEDQDELAELIPLLAEKISAARYEKLDCIAEEILVQGIKRKLTLTKKERCLLERLYSEQSAEDYHTFGLEEITLRATDGTELHFQILIGDSGDLEDQAGPYEHKRGEFLDKSEYIVIEEY